MLSIHTNLTLDYPDHHITRTNAAKCDVLGYAAAGLATATPYEEPGYDATRFYRAPRSRLDGGEGKLEDVVGFGKWKYEFHGNEFVVYEINYLDKFMEKVQLQFILADPSPEHINGLHHQAVDSLLLAAGAWTLDAHEQVWAFDNSRWSKSHDLWQAVQGTTWNDIVLEPCVRAKLHRDVHDFFDNRELYAQARIPWKRGIISHGVPGNGKSMTLAVTINELAKRDAPVPALYVKSLDACAGPKWSLQQIFNKARKTAPCLLICEDLDSLVTDNTRSYFLNEVDGLASNDGILIIGSTNHLDRLDTSVTKRPSRFDRKYHFQLPSEPERLAYCRYWRSKFNATSSSPSVLGDDFSDELCKVIAKWTEGYSFAYLKELFVTALLLRTQGEDEDDLSDGRGGKADAEVNGSNGSMSPENAQAIETNGNISKDEAGNDVDDEESSEPRVLPAVTIPPSLKDNPLFDIFRTQAQTLLEEMDHSANSRPPPSGGREPSVKHRLPNLLDDDDDDDDDDEDE